MKYREFVFGTFGRISKPCEIKTHGPSDMKLDSKQSLGNFLCDKRCSMFFFFKIRVQKHSFFYKEPMKLIQNPPAVTKERNVTIFSDFLEKHN